MQIAITPTGRFTSVEGTRCRIWTGTTDKGVPCELMIAFVQVKCDEDNAEFERALREIKAEPELVSFDYRMV